MRIDRIKLIVLMTQKNMNVLELAELSGVSRATVTAVKSGKSCAITTAARIAKALGVDVTEILEEG